MSFKLSRYITPVVSDIQSQIVVLSITNNLHMSCSMKGDQAVLNLEVSRRVSRRDVTVHRDVLVTFSLRPLSGRNAASRIYAELATTVKWTVSSSTSEPQGYLTPPLSPSGAAAGSSALPPVLRTNRWKCVRWTQPSVSPPST